MRRRRALLWFAATAAVLLLAGAAELAVHPVRCFERYAALRMRLAGAASRTVLVGSYRIHYYAEGPVTGPAVVLVHGLGGRAEDWRNLAPYLARAGYRAYLPDLPGYGQSDKPMDFSYSVRDQAAVVVGFFDALGLGQADLGGWSMGGWIVQLVAAEHPDRVRRLMLFDAAGLYQRPTWDTNLFTPSTPGQISQLDALLMPHPPPVPGFVARDMLGRVARNGWVVRRALASMLTGKDATDRLLPQMKMPVLLVWGSLDRITPVDEAEKMHALAPQSQLDIVSGCGHLAPSQCAAQIGPRVVQFVQQR